jgi:fatty-acyl-CoA synthase
MRRARGMWRPITFSDMLGRVSKRFSSNEAIVYRKLRISYRELKDQAERVARAFLGIGVQKGDKVSLWLHNCPEWIYIQLALGMIGAVLVPINTRFKINELQYTLKQSDSRVLVTMDRFLNTDFAGIVYEAIPELRRNARGRLRSRNFPVLEKIICIGKEPRQGMLSWGRFLRKAAEIAEQDFMQRQRQVEPDDVVMIQYTSGTTSFPKGAMLTHNGVLRNSFQLGQRMGIEEGDRNFCPLPFFHVGGAVISTLVAFQYGAALIICDTYDPEAALRIVEKERCTAMSGIETHFLMMYEHQDFAKYNLSSLEKGWTIGQPQIVRDIYEKLGMKKILNIYGISEASPNVTATDIDDPLEFRMYWHGKPHPQTQIKIVDYEKGASKPPHREGEICVRGWNVMKGYYKKPEETRIAIDNEGWLHTGDSGLVDEEGNLKFTGRIKDIIRVGGENVSAMEVENFILTHPKVKNVSVIGVDERRLTEVCLAVIQLKDGEKATEKEIIEYCKGKIAGFKIPRYVRFTSEFPMTGSGKIQKFLLKEKFGPTL